MNLDETLWDHKRIILIAFVSFCVKAAPSIGYYWIQTSWHLLPDYSQDSRFPNWESNILFCRIFPKYLLQDVTRAGVWTGRWRRGKFTAKALGTWWVKENENIFTGPELFRFFNLPIGAMNLEEKLAHSVSWIYTTTKLFFFKDLRILECYRMCFGKCSLCWTVSMGIFFFAIKVNSFIISLWLQESLRDGKWGGEGFSTEVLVIFLWCHKVIHRPQVFGVWC